MKFALLAFLSFCCLFMVQEPAYAQNAQEPFKGAYTEKAFADGAIREAYCGLVEEVESSFGALAFVVAGVMAFSFAAFGDTKRAYLSLMVGVIGATIGTGISLYFGNLCQGSGQGFDRFQGDINPGNGGGFARSVISSSSSPLNNDFDNSQEDELF